MLQRIERGREVEGDKDDNFSLIDLAVGIPQYPRQGSFSVVELSICWLKGLKLDDLPTCGISLDANSRSNTFDIVLRLEIGR